MKEFEMKRIIDVFCAVFIMVVLLNGCIDSILDPKYGNNPVDIFEYLWDETDRCYALFDVKGVDWQGEYNSHRPSISDSMNEDELWLELTGMLSVLNDNHVYLMAPGREVFMAGSLYRRPAFPDSAFENYKRDVLALHNLAEASYLENVVHPHHDNRIVYGTVRTALAPGKLIGYIYLGEITDTIQDGFSKAMTALAHTDGIIIDLRFNEGGESFYAQDIASYFTRSKILYMTSRTRNGPRHDDFASPRYWYLEPKKNPYTAPVAVLQNAYTHSAACNLTLGLRVLPQVRLIGENTSGAYSNTLWRELPNGWVFSLSTFLMEDANGVCWEGIGTPPDIVSVNTLAQINGGTDTVLETGINWIMSY
jgi:carboxyl-terminal processing protease